MDEWEFMYKGCWNCTHFSKYNEFLYTEEAAEELEVSVSTIRRWLHRKLLEGKLYWRIRKKPEVPVYRWLIKRSSVERLKERLKVHTEKRE